MASAIMDSVTLVGNVKLDTNDNAYAPGEGDRNARFQFSVAVTPRVKNPNTNAWEDGTTTWHNYITAWGPLAEHAHDSLKNGDQVIVIGHNQTREYTDKEGNNKTSTNIVVDYLGVSLRWSAVDSQRSSSNRSASNDYNGNSAPSRSESRHTAPASAPKVPAAPKDDEDKSFDSDSSFDELFN
jgi:single-strand DNA-binding protein